MIGGYNYFSWHSKQGNYLSSTEMLKTGDTKWTLLSTTLPFPHGIGGIKGVTVDNIVYITGGMVILITKIK